MTISIKIIIDKRIKTIEKGIRQARKDWTIHENLRRKISKEASQYGNIYDYSTTMGHEDQKKYDGAEYRGGLAIKKQIALKDEKEYLKGILKGKIIKYDKYDWEYNS